MFKLVNWKWEWERTKEQKKRILDLYYCKQEILAITDVEDKVPTVVSLILDYASWSWIPNYRKACEEMSSLRERIEVECSQMQQDIKQIKSPEFMWYGYFRMLLRDLYVEFSEIYFHDRIIFKSDFWSIILNTGWTIDFIDSSWKMRRWVSVNDLKKLFLIW